MKSNRKIESLGVGKLSDLINDNDLLQAYIDSNDKTPMWDGEVHVLKAASDKKEDIIGRVPIQVKTTQRKTRLNSFDISASDLISYKSDGGIFFFVVFLDSEGKLQKICYRSLLPLTIRNLLRKSKLGKNSQKRGLSVTIYDLNESELYSEMRHFLDERMRQISFSNDKNQLSESIPEDREFRFYFTGSSPISVFQYQKKHEIFPYIIDKYTGAEIPVGNDIKIASIFEETDLIIKLGDEYLFNDVKRIYNSDGSVELRFATGFTISIFSESEREFSFSFERPNSLLEAIYNTRVLLEFSSKGYIYINEHKLNFQSENLRKLNNLNLNEQLTELDNLKSSLEKLGIAKDLDLSEFDDKSRKNLLLLEDGLLKKEKVTLNFDESKLINAKIGNLHYLLMYHQDNVKSGFLVDIFKETPWCRETDEDGNTREISIFDLFSIEDWLQIDNCDIMAVISSYNRLLKSSDSFISANNALIRIIAAYDRIEESNKKMELLSWAKQLSEWNMIHSTDKPRSIINHLQLKQRLEELSENDIEELSSLLIECRTDPEICFGVAVLLKSKLQANLYWRKLSSEKQESYSDYPIFNLYCKLT